MKSFPDWMYYTSTPSASIVSPVACFEPVAAAAGEAAFRTASSPKLERKPKLLILTQETTVHLQYDLRSFALYMQSEGFSVLLLKRVDSSFKWELVGPEDVMPAFCRTELSLFDESKDLPLLFEGGHLPYSAQQVVVLQGEFAEMLQQYFLMHTLKVEGEAVYRAGTLALFNGICYPYCSTQIYRVSKGELEEIEGEFSACAGAAMVKYNTYLSNLICQSKLIAVAYIRQFHHDRILIPRGRILIKIINEMLLAHPELLQEINEQPQYDNFRRMLAGLTGLSDSIHWFVKIHALSVKPTAIGPNFIQIS